VEVHIQRGIPGFAIVGLVDRAVQEVKHRIRSGVASADLPIALAISARRGSSRPSGGRLRLQWRRSARRFDVKVVGGTGQATLIASVAGAKRIFFGGRPYIQVRLKLTLSVRVAADLVEVRHKRYARWNVRVGAGVHNVRFALRSVHLRTGHRYQLRLTLRNGTQVVVRRTRAHF